MTTPKNTLQTVVFLDDAREHSCYHDNSPASCLADWILFNARAMVRAEAVGDANYVLELGRQRQNKLRTYVQTTYTLPTRNADGTLPSYTWPGGYPVLYLDNLNDTLCAECASKNSDVVAYFVHYEGPAEECAECGDLVASAYGDPSEDTKEQSQ